MGVAFLPLSRELEYMNSPVSNPNAFCLSPFHVLIWLIGSFVSVYD